MFESAELGHTIDDRKYQKHVEMLRTDLLEAQCELFDDHGFSVVVLVDSVDGAGKGETVNLLYERLDPRHVRTRRSPKMKKHAVVAVFEGMEVL